MCFWAYVLYVSVCVWINTLDLSCNNISKCNVNSWNLHHLLTLRANDAYKVFIYQPFLSILSLLEINIWKYCIIACVLWYFFWCRFLSKNKMIFQTTPSNKTKFVLIFIYANVKRCYTSVACENQLCRHKLTLKQWANNKCYNALDSKLTGWTNWFYSRITICTRKYTLLQTILHRNMNSQK